MIGRTLLLSLSVLILVSCASAPTSEEREAVAARTAEELAASPGGTFHGRMDLTRTARLASFDDAMRDARRARVVYVGETHTNAAHHAMQLRVVEAMWRQNRRLTIGFEMFFRPFQHALDAYLAREIGEEELLRRSEYLDRWRFPWEHYAPVLRFAREKGIPVVALNLPSEITRTVSRQGLDALTTEQRAEIPELDLSSEEHRAFVREVFLGGHQMPEERFENFYTAMCVWDDGMAESVVRSLRSDADEERRMVVIVGAGHVRRRFGIPDRVERRTGWRQLVLVPIETRPGETGGDWKDLVAGDDGDYLYLTPPAPVVVPKRIGIMVETENPPAEGLGVRSVTAGGPASRADLAAGDVILRLGDRPMVDLFALRLFLDRAERGRAYRVIVRRGEERLVTSIVLPTKGRPPADDAPTLMAVKTVHLRIAAGSARPRVFRQMVAKTEPGVRHGDVVRIVDRDGVEVGEGFYNGRSEIAVRILARPGEGPVDEGFFRKKVVAAVRLRRDLLGLDRVTDAYRVFHAEADGIPGLIVDRYDDLLSAEVSVLGTYERMPQIMEALRQTIGFRAFAVRDEPRFAKREGFRIPPVGKGAEWRRVIREGDTRFEVDVTGGHKTGFFLDQRDTRTAFAALCRKRRVLDLCCHAGGFGIRAAREGGASSVRCVDLDEGAVALARRNADRNGVKATVEQADAFDVLRALDPGEVDALVLDPPKLLRSRDERNRGLRKYLDLNTLALRALESGAVFLTCSCSGLVDEATFLETVRRASRDAGRRLRILRLAGAPPDHPIDPDVPETRYLKTVLAQVV